jgi:hypothetical protein
MPYTKALLSAVPIPDPDLRDRRKLNVDEATRARVEAAAVEAAPEPGPERR